MTCYVKEDLFLGKSSIIAGNEHLEITIIPSWGSNLISIITKDPMIQILRTPKTLEEYEQASVQYGTPVLFPPNRIRDGQFTFQNRSYSFDLTEPDKHNHIHGFVYTKPWEVEHIEADKDKARIITTIKSSDFPDITSQFPHSFTLKMIFTLEGTTIKKEAHIINESDESFPWGLGYHTTFQFPEATSRFSLQASKQWELNERLLPTEQFIPIPYEELTKGMSLEAIELDDAFLTDTEANVNEAVMTLASEGLQIQYRADDQFKHWVVYNNDGKQGYVCPEPYTWITDAPNLSLPYDITGLQVLAPGSTATATTEIHIQKI